jgi:hypothetical protein
VTRYLRAAGLASAIALAALAWSQTRRVDSLKAAVSAAEERVGEMEEAARKMARQAAELQVARDSARDQFEMMSSKVAQASDACLDRPLPAGLLD